VKSSSKRPSASPSTPQAEPVKTEPPADLSGIIKDQLILISFLVLLAGIVSTETYYAVFGVKYQFLSLPSFHLIYRGLTCLIDAPLLIITYAAAALWLVFDMYAAAKGWNRFLQYRGVASYVFLSILLLMTYVGARVAGRREAERDLVEQTCSLPKIVNLSTSQGETFGLARKYRLFMDGDYIMVFKPIDPAEGDGQTLENTVPKMKRLKKEDLGTFETSR
jgi:hypothetical protein